MASLCLACQSVIEESDNFCRRCGVRASDEASGLPVTRPSASVTLWRPQASPVVKGAAVMAAGTIGQFVVRRAISGLMGGGRNPRARGRSMFSRRQTDGLQDEAQIITETIMVRRVRIRRPS